MPKIFAQLGKESVALNTHCSINAKGELLIYGDIGDWWEGVTAKDIVAAIDSMEGSAIVVRINSDGGNYLEGFSMYHALRASGKKVVTYIDGIAASAGGTIFLAGEDRHIPANAFFHMHRAHGPGYGNPEALRDAADQVESIERSYVGILAERSGVSVDAIYDIISDGKEYLYRGQEAVDAGFATQLFDYEIPVAAKLNVTGNLRAALDTHVAALPILKPAAAAAKTQTKKGNTMLFKVKAKAGGMSAAVAILISAALQAKEYSSAGDALAAVGVDGFTVEMLDGSQTVDDAVLKSVAAKLDVEWAENPAPVKKVEELAGTNVNASKLAAIATEAKLDASVVKGWIDNGISVEEAGIEALKTVAKRDEGSMPGASGVRTVPAGSSLRAAMAQAMLVRVNPSVNKHTDESSEFAYASLMDLAKAHLSLAGEDVRGISPSEVMAKAYSAASDFPLILADVGNKEMLAAYKRKARSFTSIARRATMTDFKERHVVTMGSGSALGKVGENGEYKTGKFSEAGNSYKLDSYGRIFRFGRQHMVNDDLNSIVQFSQAVGSKSAALEQRLFWEFFLSAIKFNGANLYSAGNGTQMAAGATVAGALQKMKQAMRKQKDLDGEALDLTGSILVVSSNREEAALKELAGIAATKAADVNIHSNSLSLLAESRLDDAPNDPFYLLAPVDEAPVFEYAYLQGQEQPRLETQYGFESDGMSLKIGHDFGVGCIGGRGIVKNTGLNP